QLSLSAQLLELNPRFRQPDRGLPGFCGEVLKLDVYSGAGRFGFGAQLRQIHLADTSPNGFGSGAKLSESVAALDRLPLPDEYGLNEPGGGGGGTNESLVGNEPSSDSRLAGICGGGNRNQTCHNDAAEEKPQHS